MTINTNAQVTVKLTPYGLKFLVNLPLFEKLYHYNLKGGQYEDTLWGLMATFGPSMYIGGEVPFEDNKIEIKEAD